MHKRLLLLYLVECLCHLQLVEGDVEINLSEVVRLVPTRASVLASLLDHGVHEAQGVQELSESSVFARTPVEELLLTHWLREETVHQSLLQS